MSSTTPSDPYHDTDVFMKNAYLFARNFVEVQFYHCPGEANIAADTLAKHSYGPMSIVWHEEPLSSYVLANDA
jgi:hypothetical protein